MNYLRKLRVFLAVATLLAAGIFMLARPQTAAATNPGTINFQGKVVNANGTNVTDGTYSFVFKLYSVASGGAALWTETQAAVSVTSGVFQVNLGSVTALSTIDFNANPSLYLGITFNSDPNGEMSPRPQLQSVPFAFNADKLGGLASSAYAQLSPGSAQSGNLNVTGTVQAAASVLSPLVDSISGALGIGTGSTTAVNLGKSGVLTSANGGFTATGGTVSLNDNAAFNTSINGGTSTGTVTIGSATNGNTVTLQNGANSSLTMSNLVSAFVGSVTVTRSFASISGSSAATTSFVTGVPLSAPAATTTFVGINGKATTSGANVNANTVATGIYGVAVNTSASTLGQANGVSGQVFSANTITAANALFASVFNNGTGTFTTGTGLYVQSPSFSSTGLITTATGIYIQDQKVAGVGTGYGINQVGLTDLNILNGATTFGAAGTALTVTNNASVGSLTATTSVTTPLVQSAAATALTVDSGTTGALNIGTGANAKTITLGNVSGATGLIFNSGTNGATFNQLPGGIFAITSTGTARTVDLSTISNAVGQEPTADGINAQQITWFTKPATGNMSSAQRINVTNKNTATAGQVQALRVTATGVGGAINSDTVGLYIDALTGASSGTAGENAIEIGTGWDNLLAYNGGSILNGTGILQSVALSGTYSNSLQLSNTANVYTGASATLSGTGNSLAVTGTPTATATLSLLRLGNALVGGNATAGTGGTYIGINVPTSGAGSTADLVNFQDNGTTIFKIDGTGNVNTTGVYQKGGVSGTSVAACTAAQYIGNGVVVSGGIITAGTCHADGVSDARLKQSVASINGGLDLLNQLQPVSYQFNDLYHQVSGDDHDYGTQYGFVAQQVQQVAPGLVSDFYGIGGYYGIDYHAFFGLLTAAVQDLSHQVDDLAVSQQVGGPTLTLALADGQQLQFTHNGETVGSVDADGTATFKTSIVAPELVATGGLIINSGTSGDVSIDTGSNSAYVKLGTDTAAGVTISKQGQDTTVAGALVIDQTATFHGAVTIDGGDGTAGGSFISKGGSFQMLDTNGVNLFTIDTAGNGVMAGNLNLASASISGGLTVGGDVNVAGLSTFQKLATFIGKTIFRQDVEFDGHITVAADSAGYATLRTTESRVHVSFKTVYEDAPIVSASTVDGQFIQASVSNISKDGFDISVAMPVTADTKFSWTAVAVKDAQTASNPVVASTP